MKILITGGTGQQGGAVIEALLPLQWNLNVITRNTESHGALRLKEKGVNVFQCDITSTLEMAEFMEGMDGVFALTTPFEKGADYEVIQGKSLAEAAKEAGISHFVFSSVAGADSNTGIPHFDSKYKIEEIIRSLDLNYTIIAPVYFMDNLLSPWMFTALKENEILSSAMPGNRSLQQISLKNIGEMVREVFIRGKEVYGRRIEIAGDELTGEEQAALITKAVGHFVAYKEFSTHVYEKDNPEMGLMYNWFISRGYSVDIPSLKKEFSRVEWQNTSEWLKSVNWKALLG